MNVSIFSKFVEKSGLQCKHEKLLLKIIFSESHVSSGGSTKSLAKKYIAELETNIVKKLYHLYKVDFELFQYNPDLYIQYSKKTI